MNENKKVNNVEMDLSNFEVDYKKVDDVTKFFTEKLNDSNFNRQNGKISIKVNKSK